MAGEPEAAGERWILETFLGPTEETSLDARMAAKEMIVSTILAQ